MARALEPHQSRIVFAALVLAHLVLISRQVEVEGGHSLLERVVFRLLSPFQRAGGTVVLGVRSRVASYLLLRGVQEENQQLRARLSALELEAQALRQQSAEAQRLQELLEVRQVLPFETTAASVIARDGVPWFRTVTVDKGSIHGLRLNDAVISSSGVVGRVVMLGPEAARVQLLLDRDSGVGVRVERTRVTGVVAGQVGFADTGTGDLVMRYVPSLADVVVGDVVVTSGLDKIFPKGLVVGRVHAVNRGAGLFKEVLVTPSAGFDRLEEVLVLRVPAENLTLDQVVR